jgi:glucose-6-phosphate isomerase
MEYFPNGFAVKGERLYFGKKEAKCEDRTFAQLAAVASPENAVKPSPQAAYSMYRGIDSFGTIRYDITILRGIPFGNELLKTYGHYHPQHPSGHDFCEIYEVISGTAHYLLQRENEAGELEDVVLAAATAGEKFLIPPDYGHLTINAGKKPLVMANLVFSGFASDYSLFRTRRGGAYYEFADGRLAKNKNYSGDFTLQQTNAAKWAAQFAISKKMKGKSLLELARSDISIFDFLIDPSKLE